MSPDKTQPDSALDAAARLRLALGAKPIDEGALKLAVCEYVEAMKKTGATVERGIVDLKRIAEAEDVQGATIDHVVDVSASTPVSRAVTRCIEHYFRTDLGDRSPARNREALTIRP